jgi:hypothetical protein
MKTPPGLHWDLAAVVGVLLVAAGLWWIYPPAALICLGLGAIGAALLGARTASAHTASKAASRKAQAETTDEAERKGGAE